MLGSKRGRGVEQSNPLKEGREEEEEVFRCDGTVMVEWERYGSGGAGAVENG